MRLSRAWIVLSAIGSAVVVPAAPAAAVPVTEARSVAAGDGIALPVQPPGSAVTLDVVYPDGARSYTTATDETGRVSTTVRTRVTRFPDLPGPGACDRDTYTLRDYKWDRPWVFRTKRGTDLNLGSQAAFDRATVRAVTTITRGRNTCGMRGGTGARGAFAGHTEHPGNFVYADGQTTCGTPDHHNVIDSGDLPGGSFEATLAWTCTWSRTRHGVTTAVEADIRMNDTDYTWTYHPDDPGCDPALPPDAARWHYDVESVLVHEMGHVYGLVNLSSPDDVNQTMYPGVRRCTGHMRSLGRGDVLGMWALYGRAGSVTMG